MGFATHLGPWLLGTVKNTTGTTAGTIRNMGATTVVQDGQIAYTDTTAKTIAVLPAGSQITNIFVDVTAAFNSGTNNVITIQTAGGSSLATVTATSANITTGRATVVFTAAQIATILNVGTTDLIVQAVFAGTGTAASTGAANITIQYVVLGSDGAANPTTFQN
jgi:hypothetical protein